MPAASAAVDYPRLKAGLWESTLTQAGRDAPATTSKMCLDAAVQGRMLQLGMGLSQGLCQRLDVRNDGGRIVGEADCDIAGSRVRSRSVTTFAGDSAYRTEVRATYDPPMLGMKDTRTVIDTRHVGPCPPSMRPGDMTLPGGQTVNVLKLGTTPGK